ncbi:MAG: DUF87 domain-containing protein [Candidatus Nezhaarchaeales archaeon]
MTNSKENHLTKGLRLIGITGSPTSTSSAPLIVLEGLEGEVREEEVVLIENAVGNKILAVCRRGTGINDNLKVGSYSPGVAYARSTGSTPSRSKESYYYTLSFIGAIDGSGVKRNDLIVAPGSRVYSFNGSGTNPLTFMAHESCAFKGCLAERREWAIPFDLRYASYHIGVFGTTGSGKSCLARSLLIPLLRESGFGVLVLDWSGMDYAPYFKENTIKISEFKVDVDVVFAYIMEKTRKFGYRGEVSTLSELLEEVLAESWEGLLMNVREPKNVLQTLKSALSAKLAKQEGSKDGKWIGLAQKRLETYWRKLKPEDISHLMGTKPIESSLPKRGELVVIDMSSVGSYEKLAFFLSLSEVLMTKISRGEELSIALVIDEAPQYCPSEPKGLQTNATDRIKDLCALGRKHKLCLVLISQGMAGEIGINAAVRRNLNTQFIGQIHPLDMEEASKWLSPYGINIESLLYLERGNFYFIGKMNPSPTPLLISFEVDGDGR